MLQSLCGKTTATTTAAAVTKALCFFVCRPVGAVLVTQACLIAWWHSPKDHPKKPIKLMGCCRGIHPSTLRTVLMRYAWDCVRFCQICRIAEAFPSSKGPPHRSCLCAAVVMVVLVLVVLMQGWSAAAAAVVVVGVVVVVIVVVCCYCGRRCRRCCCCCRRCCCCCTRTRANHDSISINNNDNNRQQQQQQCRQ